MFIKNSGSSIGRPCVYGKYETQSFAGSGHADQVLHAEEIGRIQGPLSTSLDGRLHGVTFIGHQGNKTPMLTLNMMGGMGINAAHKMLVIIDGLEGGDINSLNAADVETVEVLRFASASIYGMNGGNGYWLSQQKK